MNEKGFSETRNLVNKITKSFSVILIPFPEVYDTGNVNDNRIRTTKKTFEIFWRLTIMFLSHTLKQINEAATKLDYFLPLSLLCPHS